MSHRSILDLEEGETLPPQTTTNPQPPDKLKTFRNLVGIHSLPPDPAHPTRPAENQGTYKRLVDAEVKARLQYYFSSSLINTCLLAQIVIAAALTALGAANSSHVAITILGSANTVIAGGMTYLKGQGLPERLMQYANGLRKVREYLEERERQFMRSDCQLDVDQETRIILRMYEAVRQKAEDSYSREAGPADPKKDIKAQQALDTLPPIIDFEVDAPAVDNGSKKGLAADGSKRPQRNGTTTEEADGPLEEGEGGEGGEGEEGGKAGSSKPQGN